jgi:agmatinase
MTTTADDAPIGLLGIPFDSAVSFRPGAALAPASLRRYSQFVTPITEEGKRLSNVRIRDYGDVDRDLDWERFFKSVETAAKTALRHPFALFLGGDHSVTIPLHRAFAEVVNAPWGIIHIDAHTDLMDSYMGHPWSHACTARRALELPGMSPDRLSFFGIRSFEEHELVFLEENPSVGLYSARWMHRNGVDAAATEAIRRMAGLEPIYLTLDIDCLDPAYAPGTGTPEAGGLTTRDLMEFLRLLFAALPIRVMDVVEIAPPLDSSDITTVAALKLLYEVFGWKTGSG